MDRYDNYNPTITDEEELDPVLTVGPSGATPKPHDTSRRKRQPKAKASEKKQQEPSVSLKERVMAVAHNPLLRIIVGLVLMFFGAYLTICFVSYLATCGQDQSEIHQTAIGMAKGIANSGGEGGARMSSFLINDCFGLASFVIIFWTLAIGLKLLGLKLRYKTVNFTIKCLIALIAASLIIGLVTIGTNTPVNWGGLHGRHVNEFVISFLGWAGAALLSLLVATVFCVLCLRDLGKWLMKLHREAQERRRIALQEKEAELERERQRIELERKEQEEAAAMANLSRLEMEEERQSSIDEEDEEPQPEEDPISLTSYSMPDEEEQGAAITPESISSYTMEEDNPTIEALTPETKVDEPAIDEYADEGEEQDTEVLYSESQVEDEEEDTNAMLVHVNSIGEAATGKQLLCTGIPGMKPYKFPPYELMVQGDNQGHVDAEEQAENEEKIRETLRSFGIEIKSIEATVGPTVTLYEIVPDQGIKIARIRNLSDEIAMALEASASVRIIAPIPGRSTVGIEVANKTPVTVSMRTIIKSEAFQKTRYHLPIALGSTISNEVYVADLAKMPHLLVAGATGQGKSVGLNAIVASLLYSKSPDELKFVMFDPKMVEFSFYAKIEHQYLAKLPGDEEPIITDMQKVMPVLTSLCIEMDERYLLLKDARCKKLEEYNNKIKAGELDPERHPRYLPYIVVIVDEFADLMMMAGKEVEKPIARLAQKARAVGMHVIIATQRPSTDVITGVIKANFPARIAFKVSNGIDSKTILNTTAAFKLIGRGDMLISHNSDLVRVQCAFIDTPEVEDICDYVARQPYPRGAYILPEPPAPEGSGEAVTASERDSLFEEAARMVVMASTASTSALQRRYSIGYARAGKIMDQLERAGIVGPSHDGKPRTVLMDEVALENYLANMD